jgi:hypothetical protein
VPTEVVCPTCNTVARLDEVGRDASCFCQTCDYPLFWANQTSFASAPGLGSVAGNGGLRRLPGTEGWAISDQITCPECAEPNLVTENYCVRCGADLHPRPAVPTYVPLPPPVPAPLSVRKRRRWWPVLVAVGVVVVGVVSWALVQYVF